MAYFMLHFLNLKSKVILSSIQPQHTVKHFGVNGLHTSLFKAAWETAYICSLVIFTMKKIPRNMAKLISNS